MTGRYPAVFGQDFGFSALDTWSQSRWVWFMNWNDPSGEMKHPQEFRAIYQSERTLTLDELPWVRLGRTKVHYPILK